MTTSGSSGTGRGYCGASRAKRVGLGETEPGGLARRLTRYAADGSSGYGDSDERPPGRARDATVLDLGRGVTLAGRGKEPRAPRGRTPQPAGLPRKNPRGAG